MQCEVRCGPPFTYCCSWHADLESAFHLEKQLNHSAPLTPRAVELQEGSATSKAETALTLEDLQGFPEIYLMSSKSDITVPW